MSNLNHFSIPVSGLKNGLHQFDFQVDKQFFDHFESSLIKDGKFDVRLFFDKRPDMLVLDFNFEGYACTDCDRCLAPIQLPLKGENQLLVKYAEEPAEEAEVVYIQHGEPILNVARFVYEYICLAIPMIKVYNCEDEDPSVCNEENLQYLEREEEGEDSQSSIWDELKKLSNND